MDRRKPMAEIVLIVVGAVLSCCWLPRGLLGLFYLVRTVAPKTRISPDLLRILQNLSLPLSWYNQLIIQRFFIRARNYTLGQVLNAIPMCLCPLVAIALLVVGIALYTRASGAGRE